MRRIALLLAATVVIAAAPRQWEVSEADRFGWRRALVATGEARLAVVCPPDQPPFAVPVTAEAGAELDAGRFTLGLEVDGERFDQPMVCSRVLCEAELPAATWDALTRGRRVTLWVDDRRGPTLPLAGSAAALRACSSHY